MSNEGGSVGMALGTAPIDWVSHKEPVTKPVVKERNGVLGRRKNHHVREI